MSEKRKPRVFNESIDLSAASGFGATVKAHNVLPDNHPFYILVGRVASEWAHLEHALDTIIWDLSDTDQRTGSCITGNLLGHWSRVNAIHALVAHKGGSDELLKRIETFGNRVSSLAKKRNRFVHDAWYIDDEGTATQFVSYSAKERKFGHKDIDEGTMRTVCEDIRNKIKELRSIRNEISEEISL